MSEIAILLQEIAHQLEQKDPQVVGAVELSEETLSVCDGKLKLTADLYEEPDSPPSMVHVHVQSAVEDKFNLDACMIGISSDREAALKQAGRNWVSLVAGPVLSLIHQIPVLDAEPFEGSEKWGISGCRGYVGPLMVRLLDDPEDDSDTEHLGEESFFSYVSELSPPGVYHLAKAVIQADPKEGWVRSIEIDGHEVSYTDAAWPDVPPTPKQQIIGSRFAAFHYTDQEDHVARRTKLDETIHQFVNYCYQFNGNTEQVAETMVSEGYDGELVDHLIFMVPLAFGRTVLANHGVKLSPFYIDVTSEGHSQEELIRDAAYARSLAIGAKLSRSEEGEAFRVLALLSSEINAANKAVQKQYQLADLELLPPVIPAPGVSQEDVDQAVQAVVEKMESEKESIKDNHSKKRPW